MRLRDVLFLFLILSGVSFAQDTNFSTGPQYLITSDSMFRHPISTPSLSLGAAQNTTIAAETTALAQEASVPPAVTSQIFFADVYWGDHTVSDIESRRIVTPSLSLSETAANAGTTTTETEAAPSTPSLLPNVPTPSAETSSVIEISSAELPRALPASIFDAGVTGMADAQSLRERGFGVPLGEVAAYWKSHKPSAARVFTNRDIQRMHGG